MPSSQNDALSHAMAMVVAPLAMGLFGGWLDGVLGTGWVLAAVFAGLGVIGAFASAYYRYEARISAQDAGKPWTRRARPADEASQ
ncbi:MAG: AtpZ/AtpI family protein [Actinomycetota bacterium]